MKTLIKMLNGILFLALPFVANTQVGNPAPDFTVTDTHGKSHTLYQYLEADKVVVLDFFYTTCGPCQFYSPQVNLAYEKYGCNTNNVIFISIDHNDTDDEVLAYDDEYHIQYPSVSGLEGGGNSVVAQYNILGFPTFYVIDSTFTIIEEIDPPTLQVFDFRFQQHGIDPAECNANAVPEPNYTNQLELFPNPLGPGDLLNVKLPGSSASIVHFEIFNFTGNVVKTGQAELKAAKELKIEMNNLVAGIYVIKISPLGFTQIYTGVFVKE